MTLLSDKRAELRSIRDRLLQLEDTITKQSVRILVVSGLELYLSLALVVSLFEFFDADNRDTQELSYMMRMAWIPLFWGLLLAFGHRIAPKIAPAPDNLDRNLRILKLATYGYALAFLIWDSKMVIKKGPALQVAVLFAFCDLARYEMEIAELIEDDDEEDEAAERELERMVEALNAAKQAANDEAAFKEQVQAVANRSDSDLLEYDEEESGTCKSAEVYRRASSEDLNDESPGRMTDESVHPPGRFAV